MPKLSKHEKSLLPKAIEFCEGEIDKNARFPTAEDIRLHLHCRDASAHRILKYLKGGNDRQLFAQLEAKLADAQAKRQRERLAKVNAQRLLNKTKKFGSDVDFLLNENSRLVLATEKLRLDLSNERRLRRKLSQHHAGFEHLKEQAGELVQKLGDFNVSTSPVRAHKSIASPPVSEDHSEDAVFPWGDQHFGDVIRCDDTSGFPEYDVQIAANRWHYTVTKGMQILALHRAMYPIKKLYLPILGDIGNGEIHDLVYSNQLLPIAQVHFGYLMLKFAIKDILTLVDSGVVEKIVLVFSVGNHMRIDEHMPIKLQAQRTLDWLIYQFLIEHFKGDRRIEIVQEMSPFVFVQIRNHRFCFAHGSSVHFQNSITRQIKHFDEFLGKVRAMFDSPEFRKSSGLQGPTFDKIVIGNIHVPVWSPRVVSNGSLNGQNELGVNWYLDPIPAMQWIFGVSNRHANTWFYPLESTPIQREGDNPYKEFADEYLKRYGR